MKWIGVDPGKSGGVAWIDEDGHAEARQFNNMTERDQWDLFNSLGPRTHSGGSTALIEFVSSSSQMGVKSAFTFGGSYFALRAFLIGALIPFELVRPLAWQNGMKCRTGGNKNISKARAQELWPEIKVNHYIADALLIAEHNRRTNQKSSRA